MIARSVTLLPEPDSPSSASTLPASSENVTPFTARTTPSRVLNATLRSRTIRSDTGYPCVAAIIAPRLSSRRRRSRWARVHPSVHDLLAAAHRPAARRWVTVPREDRLLHLA